MDAFALPEVLNRPLEDVVLAMKAMKISKVADFAFPTPPNKDQVDAAVKLLANVGCVDKLDTEEEIDDRNDGIITRLGVAVSRLPLGVRYGKMLLVAAEAGVLDYAIVMVAALSESNPFIHHGQHHSDDETTDADEYQDERDNNASDAKEKRKQHRWTHRGGDVMAVLLAVGAYTYASRDGGDRAARKFCEENGLNPVVMSRIQKMRIHLARLARARLSNADGVAAKTGGILTSMQPPSKVQERLLSQAIASGLLDNVAMLAPLGSIPSEHGFSMRTAYIGCSTKSREPLFMDSNSVLYSRDSRLLPKWICFDYLMRKTLKNGTPIAIMKNVTPIDPTWLGMLAKGSRLLALGEPLASPPPMYDSDKDAVVCSVLTKFGNHAWQIPCVRTDMYDALQAMKKSGTTSQHFFLDDSFRWFVRFLLEGKVLPELAPLEAMLNDSPAKITRQTPVAKVALLVSACASAGVDTAAALRKHWATVDDKFLFLHLKSWILVERRADAKKLWIETVKQNVKLWKLQQRQQS
jgi:ATP-dependent RNA helicase DHX37/DHR1